MLRKNTDVTGNRYEFGRQHFSPFQVNRIQRKVNGSFVEVPLWIFTDIWGHRSPHKAQEYGLQYVLGIFGAACYGTCRSIDERVIFAKPTIELFLGLVR